MSKLNQVLLACAIYKPFQSTMIWETATETMQTVTGA